MYLCIEVIQIQLKKKSHRLPHKKHPMIHIKMLRFGLFLDGQFLGSYFATFAGKTSSRPRLFSKDLALKDLPRLYKAADAFVLPTRGVRRLAMENKYHPDESSFRNMKNLYMRHSKSFFLKNGPCSLGCENSILGGGGGVIWFFDEGNWTAEPSSRWRMGTATCGGDVYGTSCDCHKLEWIYCHLTSRIHGYVKSVVAARWRS